MRSGTKKSVLFSLEGMNALVTGATGSIGRSLSLTLAKQGANVVLSGTRDDMLNRLRDEISEETGRVVHSVRCDLSERSQAESLIELSEASLGGGIDILVNNAGVNRDKLLMKMELEDLDFVLNVNLRAVFTLTKSAVKSMSKRKFGRIINMSSVVGLSGNYGQVNYCASKSSIIGLSKSAALEYSKRGITVNCVAPGAIESEMLNKLSQDALDKFLSRIPMGCVGSPQDVANACCFLASREASYITGQTIHVNGGMLMP